MDNIDLDKIAIKINTIRQDPTMYTLQRNPEVREHQKRLWMHVIYFHCFMNHIYSLTPTDLQSFEVSKHPDQQSNRSLKMHDIKEILQFMKNQHYAFSEDDNVFVISGRNRMKLIADGLKDWAKEDPVDREQMLIADIHDDEKFVTIPVEFLVKVAQYMENQGDAVFQRLDGEPSIKFLDL